MTIGPFGGRKGGVVAVGAAEADPSEPGTRTTRGRADARGITGARGSCSGIETKLH